MADDVVPFRARVIPVATLAGIFLFNFLARYIWGPLLPSIEADLEIDHTASGSLFLVMTAGYFVGLLTSGYLSSRLNHHKAIVISCCTCAMTLVLAVFTPSLIYLRTVLIAIGFTGGLFLPSGMASYTYRLAPKDFGKAFSFHEIAPSLGLIIGPLLVELLLGSGTWRIVLVPIAFGLFGIGIVYALRFSTGPFRGEPPTLGNMFSIVSRSAFWLMLILFTMCIGANVGVYSMLPVYMQAERGMDQAMTNFLLSASRIAAIFSPFITGWTAHRFGPKAVLAVCIPLTGIATMLLGLAPNNWLWLPLFVQSPLVSSFFPPAFAALTAITPERYRNLIISLMMPAAMLLGSGALPTMIGAFGDSGMFDLGFILIGGLVAASTFLIFFLKVPARGVEN